MGHSRKTARGASSPAKPALHIPELQHWSVSEKEVRTIHPHAEPEFIPFLCRPDENCVWCGAGGLDASVDMADRTRRGKGAQAGEHVGEAVGD